MRADPFGSLALRQSRTRPPPRSQLISQEGLGSNQPQQAWASPSKSLIRSDPDCGDIRWRPSDGTTTRPVEASKYKPGVLRLRASRRQRRRWSALGTGGLMVIGIDGYIDRSPLPSCAERREQAFVGQASASERPYSRSGRCHEAMDQAQRPSPAWGEAIEVRSCINDRCPIQTTALDTSQKDERNLRARSEHVRAAHSTARARERADVDAASDYSAALLSN